MTTLVMSRGDTANFDVYVTHPITGQPVDIDTASIVMNATTSPHGNTRQFQVTTAAGDIVPTPGETGRALVTLPTGATSGLPNEMTRLFFEVIVTIDTDVWTVDRGMLLVLPNVPVPA